MGIFKELVMSKNFALTIAGIIFGLVSLMHLLRILFSINIIIAGYVIPMWVSGVGCAIPFILCLLMFVARKKP